MDFWATKTHAEREDEETERLIHPAPKQKPPRHDRRRERIDTRRDSDTDDDPDIKNDPDLSMNYKDIGGSVVERVAARFMRGSVAARVAARFKAAKGEVKVRRKDTGQVVNVTEESLKERPGEYEKIEEDEGRGEGESAEARELKHGEALRSLAKDDEKLQSVFKSLLNPKSDTGGLAHANPDLPASVVLKGVELPEGVKTLGDVVRALRTKPQKQKSPKTPPAPEAPAAEPPKTEPSKAPPPAEAPAAEPPKAEPLKEAPSPEAPAAETSKAPPTPEAPAAEPPKAEPPAEAPAAEAPATKDKPEAPKAEPDEGEPEPKKKPKEKGKKKDDDEDEEPVEIEEPSEAEKAGIKPPQRREASEAERMQAANLIMDTFPEDIATDLLAKNLHPDDVSQLVDTYHSAKQMTASDPGAFAEQASAFYEPKFNKVKPPAKGKNAAGELVPFDTLTPDEKSEAMRQHQLQVTALSLGAREALTRSLSFPSRFSKKARIPQELAKPLAEFMLRKGDEAAADAVSEKMFSSALTGSAVRAASVGMDASDKAVKSLMSRLPPAAKKLAGSYFQAVDYHEARSKFLGDAEEQVSERSNPKDVFRTMKKARSYFEDRAKLYGDDPHRAQTLFEARVLDRLRSLAPKKYDQVRHLMGQEQKAEYDKKKAQSDEEIKQWEQRKAEWEKKQPVYRAAPFTEPRPEEPRKPPLYHLAEDPKKARREADTAIGEVLGRSKMAARVAQRFVFTYLGVQAMGQRSDKTGVYHGADPQGQYPGAYPEWQQAHQRDLGESDYTAILGMAKEWLRSSVLTAAMDGVVRDQQLRAALDLAIRDSKYADQIPASTYDVLLARLAGVPVPGPGKTLLTIREAADPSFSPLRKGNTMKPSQELRKLAAEVAEKDPKVAFDMIELAERMEKAPAPKVAAAPAPVPDARYSELRKLCIRTAAVDASAKKVLLPILQAIKNFG